MENIKVILGLSPVVITKSEHDEFCDAAAELRLIKKILRTNPDSWKLKEMMEIICPPVVEEPKAIPTPTGDGTNADGGGSDA